MISGRQYVIDRDSIILERGTVEDDQFTADPAGHSLHVSYHIRITEGTHSDAAVYVAISLYEWDPMAAGGTTAEYTPVWMPRRSISCRISEPPADATITGNSTDGWTVDAVWVDVLTPAAASVYDGLSWRVDLALPAASYGPDEDNIFDSLSTRLSTIPPLLRGDITGRGLGIGVPASEQLDPWRVKIDPHMLLIVAAERCPGIVQGIYDMLWPIGSQQQYIVDDADDAEAHVAALNRDIETTIPGVGTVSVLHAGWQSAGRYSLVTIGKYCYVFERVT